MEVNYLSGIWKVGMLRGEGGGMGQLSTWGL